MTGIDRRAFMGVSAAVLSTGCLHSRNTASDPPDPVDIDVRSEYVEEVSEYPEEVTVGVQVFEDDREVFSDSTTIAPQDVSGTFEDVVSEAGIYEVEVETRDSDVIDSGSYYWSVSCTSRNFVIDIDAEGNIDGATTIQVEPQVDACGEQRRVPDEFPQRGGVED